MTTMRNAPTRRAASSTWIVFVRHVQVYRQAPGLLLITLAAPLGMLLLFGYVFGGALAGAGDAQAYRAFLVPGVFVLVAAMGLTATEMSANSDLRSGLTDRFRSLPMSSRSVPGGLAAAAAETVTGVLAFVLMGAVGLLVGWRIDAGPGSALIEHVLGILHDHPADVETKLELFAVLNGMAVLFVQNELAGEAASAQRQAGYLIHAAGTGEFPLLAGLLSGQPDVGTPRSAAERFADVLERVLAGLVGPAA